MKITINTKSVTVNGLNYPAANIMYGFQQNPSGALTGKVELVHNSTLRNLTQGYIDFSELINEETNEPFASAAALKTFFTANFKPAGGSEFDGTVSVDQVEGLAEELEILNERPTMSEVETKVYQLSIPLDMDYFEIVGGQLRPKIGSVAVENGTLPASTGLAYENAQAIKVLEALTFDIPTAPEFTWDDATDKIIFTGGGDLEGVTLTSADVEVSVLGAAPVPYTDLTDPDLITLRTGRPARVEGHWAFRFKAATGRVASAWTYSEAFTLTPIVMDTNYQAVLNAATGTWGIPSIGLPSEARQVRDSLFVQEMKDIGIFQIMDEIGIFCTQAERLEFGRICWKHPTVRRVDNAATITLNPNKGRVGNGTSGLGFSLHNGPIENASENNNGRLLFLSVQNGDKELMSSNASQDTLYPTLSVNQKINSNTQQISPAFDMSGGGLLKGITRSDANNIRLMNGTTIEARTRSSARSGAQWLTARTLFRNGSTYSPHTIGAYLEGSHISDTMYLAFNTAFQSYYSDIQTID